jgi:hypothetical protein
MDKINKFIKSRQWRITNCGILFPFAMYINNFLKIYEDLEDDLTDQVVYFPDQLNQVKRFINYSITAVCHYLIIVINIS